MNDDQLNQFVKNNIRIGELFVENEKLLKSAGYNPPCSNFSVKKEERINMPAGYIRKSGDFWKKYHLVELVESRNTRNNISYALQLSDYYNFLVNRFNVWGSIEIMLYKQAFVNIVSIIEALILESANRMNKFCQKCPNISRCKNNICSRDRENMKCAVEKLFKMGVLKIDSEKKLRLIELYDLRNKIHIRLNEQNEFLDNKYNMNLYNEAIRILQIVDEQLCKNAVPLYQSCIGFERK